MIEVPTPRGPLKVSPRQAARARDRLYPLSEERRRAAGEKARGVLERRHSHKAAAILAAAAALAALTLPGSAG
jgi:hypothetical protein